jgi:hypothetical protein
VRDPLAVLRGIVEGEFCDDDDCLGCGRESIHSIVPEEALAAVKALLEAARAVDADLDEDGLGVVRDVAGLRTALGRFG